MRARPIILLTLLITFFYCVNFQISVIPAGSWVSLEPLDEEPDGLPFMPAVTSTTDYVDARQSLTYGSTTNDPPNGMGANDDTSTDLLEGSYVGSTSYTTLDGPLTMDGTYPPSGWSNTLWVQISSGGNPDYYARSTSISSGHYFTSPAYDLSSYTGARFSWDWKSFGSDNFEAGDLDIECYTGAWLQEWTNSNCPTSWTSTSDTQATSYNGWRMRFYFYNDNTNELVGIDNVEVEGYTETTYYRFEAVFRFDSVSHSTYTIEKLYVDFDSTSSAETLTWYGGTSSNPTTVIKSAGAGNSDFNVDISATLTGTPYYVRIVDDSRSGDTDQDTWKIDRCYLYLENQPPTNDGTPTTNSLYDSTFLYAHKSPNTGNFAHITTYHNDPDGYADITYCYIEGYTGSQYWQVRYTRSSDAYLITVGSGIIAIEDGSEAPSGNDLDITWHIEIDWDHADVSDMDIKCYTYDSAGASAATIYDVNWDVETRVEHQSGPTLSQTVRCDPGESLTISGDWQYYGSASHVAPDPAETDVYIERTPTPGSWTTDVDSNGAYSKAITASSTVQIDTFTVYLREQGTTSSLGSGSDTVQVDRVVIHTTGYVDQYINAGIDSAVLYCQLRYESDSAAITSASSFQINDYSTWRSFSYDGGDGRWEVTIPAKSTPNAYTFSDESITTNEGVSTFNSEQTWIQSWLRIRVLTTTSDKAYADYSGTAQIRVTADLEGISHTLGSGDTLYIHDGTSGYLLTWDSGNSWFEYDATKSAIALYTWTVWTSSANEATYGITVVNTNSQAVNVIWDRTRLVSYTVVTPSGIDRVAVGDTVTYDAEIHFDYDEQDVISGTITINGIAATYTGANGKWRFTDTKASMQSVTYNNMQSSGNARSLTVEDNTVTHTEIWDIVLLTITANCSWTVIDHYIQLTGSGVYDYDDTAWSGTVTWTTPFYTSSTVQNVNYGAERIASITSNENPYVDAFSVISGDSVVFDNIGLSSAAYWWVQYTESQVWLVFEVGSIYWQYNSSDVSNSPQLKIQSYINGTADDWARVYDGTIGSMLIGSFNPQWYFCNLSLNAEITVSDAYYNWTVWNDTLQVDILHSIHVDDSVIYLTDEYVTIGIQTNWGNACIPVWDQLIDNVTPVYYSASEGWFQIPISDMVGTHNLTILINGSHSGALWTGNVQDWSIDTERYSWAWRQFVYVVNPVVSTYETKIVLVDSLGAPVDFDTFEVYRNGTRLYSSECVTYSSYAYNITAKDRWGQVLNSTVFPEGDYEFILVIQVYTLKVMSWHEDFVYLNLTHGGLTYREVIAPMETVPFRLFAGSYSFAVDYRNGSIVSGNINLSDSTALIVTGSTIADLAGYSSTLLAMTTEINVTVTSTSNQVLTISIDLTNVNSTIHTQLIQLLLNVTNTNSTLYSQTIDLLAAIQNVNTTLFNQTLTVLANIQNVNSTLYAQAVDILLYVYNTNSTLYAQTISLLAEVDTVQEQAEIIEGVARQVHADLPADPPKTKEIAADIWGLILKVLGGGVVILVLGIILNAGIRARHNDERRKARGGQEREGSNGEEYSYQE